MVQERIDEIPLGTGKVVPVNGRPLIVVNTNQGIRVHSAICTHLGYIVMKEAGVAYIHCPCHDGRFNPLNGTVISGPPPRPLPPYEFEVRGKEIYVGKPLGQLYG